MGCAMPSFRNDFAHAKSSTRAYSKIFYQGIFKNRHVAIGLRIHRRQNCQPKLKKVVIRSTGYDQESFITLGDTRERFVGSSTNFGRKRLPLVLE
jgi:hypothetical protein